MKLDTKVTIIAIILIIAFVLIWSYNEKKMESKINLDNLTFNETKLNELKYNIHVDCKLLIEGDKDNLMFASDIKVGNSSMREICLGIFPDLNWSSHKIPNEK